MNKLIALLAVAIFIQVPIIWANDAESVPASAKQTDAQFVPGELLVKYKPSVRETTAEYYQAKWGLSTIQSFHTIGVQHVKLSKDMTVKAALKMFQDEARLVARLTHPGIVQVFDFGVEAGRSYLVMELLEGQPLAQRMNRGRIPVEQATAITIRILQALEAAHTAGVVHRDLKPGNVVMVGDPVHGSDVKLLDFGIALVVDAAGGAHRKTRTGMLLGTPGYMSPEQIQSIKQADARADLWSVGVIFYEMLTGERAFPANNEFARITKVLSGEPEPIGKVAPHFAHWEPFFRKALALDPGKSKARDMLRRLMKAR